MSFNKKQFSKDIKAKIKAENLNMKKAAKEIGINYSLFTRYVNMQLEPSVSKYIAIIGWLGDYKEHNIKSANPKYSGKDGCQLLHTDCKDCNDYNPG